MTKTIKYVSSNIDFINTLESTKKVKVNNSRSIINKVGILKKNRPKGYELDIASEAHGRLDVGSNITAIAENKNIALKITDAYVRNVGSSIKKDRQAHKMQLHIFSFCSKNFCSNRSYYFRSIVHITKKFSFYNIIEDESFYNDEFSSRGLLKARFGGHEVQIYVIERDNKKYLCTDCTTKIPAEVFLDFNWAGKVALGYLLGYLSQDDEYFFAFTDKSMTHTSGFIYRQQRDSIRTIYTPINTNPYGWKMKEGIAKKYYGKIKEINSAQFSKLCELSYKEEDIKAILLLITESISRSLLLMPAGLSVALEGLSSYFYHSDTEKLKPIKEKNLAKSFIFELNVLLAKYKAEKEFTGSEIILSKIQNINSPTNREKLKAPFSYQGITLSAVDEEIIEYRNDFLHGNINLKPQKGKKSYTMDSFEISLRLLTLLNMCIMKMAGYNGYIINHVKTQEKGLSKKINEDYYRKI